MTKDQSQAEAEVLGLVWVARETTERLSGLVRIDAVTLRGQFPDTTLEMTWTDLMSTSRRQDVMTFRVWHGVGEHPEKIRPPVVAENIIEDLYLRVIGD